MSVAPIVYLDGHYMPAEEARITPFDRGFLFAHAAYEVTAVYNRRLIDFRAHVDRLGDTMAGIDLPGFWSRAEIEGMHLELIERNDLDEGLIYLQVTGGDYGFRDFAGPEHLAPSIFLFATKKNLIGDTAREGLHAISLPDERWARRDMKTTQLLSQALAYRRARDAGRDTAWMYDENGLVTEAASANAWIVTSDGALITRDLSPALLPGITRASVARLMDAGGHRIEERAFSLDEVKAAAEAFTTSTGVVIAPVLSLDGEAIGDGRPGPVTRAVQRHYYRHLGADPATVAPWALED